MNTSAVLGPWVVVVVREVEGTKGSLGRMAGVPLRGTAPVKGEQGGVYGPSETSLTSTAIGLRKHRIPSDLRS